jgi:hypothetical protein
MENEQTIIVDLQTYVGTQTADFDEPKVQVGIKAHSHGIQIDLPALTEARNFGPNVFIERRPSGWAVCISPDDGEEVLCIAHVRDDGKMTVTDHRGAVLLESVPRDCKCTSCGEAYEKRDIDGGRCTKCGTMIA